MNITVWSGFSKRKNSTKQPTAGTTISNVTLKEATSIEHPTFILTGNSFDINYVQAFNHYYFVDDIKSIRNGLIEVSCSQDVMATYKSAIGATSAFIQYDTSANTEQVDRRLSKKTTPDILTRVAALRSDISYAGSYIVSLTGQHCVGTYVVTRSALDALMPDISTVFDSFVLGTDPFDAIVGAGKQIVGSGSVSENIRDVRWIPFVVSGDALEPLYVGQYAAINSNGIQVSGSRIDNRIDDETGSLLIPWQFSDWRNGESCTQIQMYIPFVGTVSYPADALKGQTSIYWDTSLDKTTGDIAINVRTAAGLILGSYGASTGVSIPLGASGMNPLKVANSIIGGAVAAATENYAGLAHFAMEMNTPLSQNVGGISSGAAAKLPLSVSVSSICHDTVVAPSSVSSAIGTPANEVKTIGSLSGYIKCIDASVALSGFDKDREVINGYLNSGFFYE